MILVNGMSERLVGVWSCGVLFEKRLAGSRVHGVKCVEI